MPSNSSKVRPNHETNLLIYASTITLTSLLTSYLTHLIIQHQTKQKDKRDSESRRETEKRRKALLNATSDYGELNGLKLDDVKVADVYLWEVAHLSRDFESQGNGVINSMKNSILGSSSSSPSGYNKLITDRECILADIVLKPGKPQSSVAYVRAGPREYLHFNPATVTAGIVTCGGLCPGLNNVIREVTHTLTYLYGSKRVIGIRGGYAGFYTRANPPIELTPSTIENIHHSGGTILGTGRGGFNLDKTIDFIKQEKLDMLFVLGGDGTHRGAYAIHEECVRLGMNVSIACVPKTIDNDVSLIDRSFGFSSAVEAAQQAIRTAKTEARCNLPNGVGIVKLMGRSAGLLSVHSVLGSGDVDLCLVPEVPIILYGEHGCLPFLYDRVKLQGYAVVVVAEGAGEELMGLSTEVDKSGNKVLQPIGIYLKEKIEQYFKYREDPATVKYIDPSYMVRSVPANAADSLYCMQLAQNAIHAAMAGYTGFSVGLCNNRMVLLPIPELCKTSPRTMDPRGRTWERILSVTRQPNTVAMVEKEVE